MTLSLRWRVPAPPIETRWRGPAGMVAAVARNPAAPVAAIVGPVGPQGIQGPEGAPTRFDFSNSATWIADHTLGRSPAVLVYLDSGERVLADITSTPINVTVTHAAARSGFILLI